MYSMVSPSPHLFISPSLVVAQVVCIYPPNRGGIGTVAAEYTRRLEARGIEVRVFHPGNTPSWFRVGHVAWMPSLLWRLRSVDVIHLHFPFYGADLFAAIASLVWRIPLVVTHHMRPKVSGWRVSMDFVNRWFFEPWILRIARTVFVATKEYAAANYIRHRNLVTMPFGVDTARFHVGRDDVFRDAHNIPRDVTVIIFVGGLDAAHYFKGVDVLLAACAKLTDASWLLLVVGSGERKVTFEARAERLGIAALVHFVGSVPFEELPRAYRAADIHVLPSINRGEAFGIVTLEAAASGLPSVVSDLPGVRSLVVNGTTGVVVPPSDVHRLADALANLLQQDGGREAMGAAARVMIETQYDAEKLIDRLIAAYENRDHH